LEKLTFVKLPTRELVFIVRKNDAVWRFGHIGLRFHYRLATQEKSSPCESIG